MRKRADCSPSLYHLIASLSKGAGRDPARIPALALHFRPGFLYIFRCLPPLFCLFAIFCFSISSSLLSHSLLVPSISLSLLVIQLPGLHIPSLHKTCAQLNTFVGVTYVATLRVLTLCCLRKTSYGTCVLSSTKRAMCSSSLTDTCNKCSCTALNG